MVPGFFPCTLPDCATIAFLSVEGPLPCRNLLAAPASSVVACSRSRLDLAALGRIASAVSRSVGRLCFRRIGLAG